MSEPASAESVSAEIIPFPLPRPEVSVTAAVADATASTDAQARLFRALQALDAAVSEQRTAVTAWRGALAELSTTMQGLGDSVQRYHGSLASLDDKVSTLHSEATRLEQWADETLASAGEGQSANPD